jgi:hypothetical protein
VDQAVPRFGGDRVSGPAGSLLQLRELAQIDPAGQIVRHLGVLDVLAVERHEEALVDEDVQLAVLPISFAPFAIASEPFAISVALGRASF